MTRRNTSESDEQQHPPHLPQYDTVDSIDEEDNITEVEVKSNRGSVSTRPHVTIKQDEVDDIGERQVTVIEIASQRGSSRRVAPKAEYAPSIPLPEHPSQQSAPPPQKARSQKPANPEMAFDIGVNNIAPVLVHKMNMDDRDPSDSVQYLNTSFFEVFAEPSEQYHSIACVWTLSFKIFEIVRIYSYKILTLIFGLIIAVVGGFLFALFAFLNIWIFRPFLILTQMALSQIVMIWPMFLIYIVRPFFYSVGAIFSTARLHTSRGDQVAENYIADSLCDKFGPSKIGYLELKYFIVQYKPGMLKNFENTEIEKCKLMFFEQKDLTILNEFTKFKVENMSIIASIIDPYTLAKLMQMKVSYLEIIENTTDIPTFFAVLDILRKGKSPYNEMIYSGRLSGRTILFEEAWKKYLIENVDKRENEEYEYLTKDLLPAGFEIKCCFVPCMFVSYVSVGIVRI